MKKDNVLAKNAKSNFGMTHWLVILLMMGFGYFSNGSMNDGLNTYVGLFVDKFGWSSANLLTYSSIAGWVSIIIIIGYTQLARKAGARKTAILSMTLAATGMFLWGRVQSPKMYFVAILILTASSSGIMVIRNLCINNWFPSKSGLALGWATMGPLIATATVLWLIRFGGKIAGFTGHFDIMVVGFVVLLLISIFWLRDDPEDKGCFPDNEKTMTRELAQKIHEKGMEYKKTSPWTIKKLLTNRQVWQIGVGVGGLNMLIGNSVMSQLIPSIMSHGFERSTAMTMMTVGAIVAIPLSYLFGVIDAKKGSRATVIIFFIWCAMELTLLILPFQWVIYPAIVMVGGMIGGSGNIMGAMTTTVFGRYDYANAFAVIYPICVAVRSCSYAFIGNLREITGGYTVPYVVLICVAVLGIVNAVCINDKMIGRQQFSAEEIKD